MGLQTYVLADREKCVGCKACELACFAEHNHRKNQVGRTVGTVTIPVLPKLYLTVGADFRAPVQCRHCEDAPCMSACAPKAIHRVNGSIVVAQSQCDGCKDCLMACPFGAIAMQPVYENGAPVLLAEGGAVKKAASQCDWCMDNPQGPACVRVCGSNALRVVHTEVESDEKRIRAAQILAVTGR